MGWPATLVQEIRKRGRPRRVRMVEKLGTDYIKPGYKEEEKSPSFFADNGSVSCGVLSPRPSQQKEAEDLSSKFPVPLEPKCLSRRRVDLSTSVKRAHDVQGCREEKPPRFPVVQVIRIRVADPDATDSDSDDEDDDDRRRRRKVCIQEIRIPFKIKREVTFMTCSEEDERDSKITKLTLRSPEEEVKDWEPEPPLGPEEKVKDWEPEPPLGPEEEVKDWEPELPSSSTPEEEERRWEPTSPLIQLHHYQLSDVVQEIEKGVRRKKRTSMMYSTPGKLKLPSTSTPEEEEKGWEPIPPLIQLHHYQLSDVVKEIEKGVRRKKRTSRMYSRLGKPKLPSTSTSEEEEKGWEPIPPLIQLHHYQLSDAVKKIEKGVRRKKRTSNVYSTLDPSYDIPGPIPDLSELYTTNFANFFSDLPTFDL